MVPGPAVVTEVDPRVLLGVLRRRKRTIALVVLLVVASTLITSLFQDPVFEGEVQVLLQPSSTESVFDPAAEQRPDAERNVGTEIEVVKSQPVRAAVVERLGPVAEAEADAVGETDIIRIAVESRDRGQAAAAAREYALAYIEFRRQQAVDDIDQASQKILAKIDDLQTRIAALDEQAARSAQQGTSTESIIASRDLLLTQQALFKQRRDELQVEAELKTGGAQLITSTAVPTSKVSPRPLRSGMIALVAGSFLGVALAFLREYVEDAVRNKEELDRLTNGIPTLALIPLMDEEDRRGGSQVVTLGHPTSRVAEAYRGLRISLQFLGVERVPRLIQVTSSVAGEGKTSTVANLAVAMANAGQRVLMIDCDLRRPSLHRFFGLPNDFGFTASVSGEISVSRAARPVPGVENLHLLSSGPFVSNPSEILSSKKTAALLAPLQENYDVVLLDSPPVLPVTDATALSAWVDATLVVVAANGTRRSEVRRAMEQLGQVEAPLAGTVLTGVPVEAGYEYLYEADDGDESARPPGGARRRGRSGRRQPLEDRSEQTAEPSITADAASAGSQTSQTNGTGPPHVAENGHSRARSELAEGVGTGDQQGDRPTKSRVTEGE